MGSEHVQVRREALAGLLDILKRMQAAWRLYQYEDDYQPHEDVMDDCKLELLEWLCPEGEMPDLDTILAQRAELERVRAALKEVATIAEFGGLTHPPRALNSVLRVVSAALKEPHE